MPRHVIQPKRCLLDAFHTRFICVSYVFHTTLGPVGHIVSLERLGLGFIPSRDGFCVYLVNPFRVEHTLQEYVYVYIYIYNYTHLLYICLFIDLPFIPLKRSLCSVRILFGLSDKSMVSQCVGHAFCAHVSRRLVCGLGGVGWGWVKWGAVRCGHAHGTLLGGCLCRQLALS